MLQQGLLELRLPSGLWTGGRLWHHGVQRLQLQHRPVLREGWDSFWTSPIQSRHLYHILKMSLGTITGIHGRPFKGTKNISSDLWRSCSPCSLTARYYVCPFVEPCRYTPQTRFTATPTAVHTVTLWSTWPTKRNVRMASARCPSAATRSAQATTALRTMNR